MKPAPYCTPAMLRALIELASHDWQCFPLSVWWQLKSRGWTDGHGKITKRGLDYVNLRARLTQLKGIKNA